MPFHVGQAIEVIDSSPASEITRMRSTLGLDGRLFSLSGMQIAGSTRGVRHIEERFIRSGLTKVVGSVLAHSSGKTFEYAVMKCIRSMAAMERPPPC